MDHFKNFIGWVTSILKYKFETWRYIQKCNMPVVIFHGNKDEVIYYASSLKLKPFFKGTDRLITLDEQGHNGITGNLVYLGEIKKILQ